jgi:hypothetical protein
VAREIDPAGNAKRGALSRGGTIIGQGFEKLGSYFGLATASIGFDSEAKLRGQAIVATPILDRENMVLFAQAGLAATGGDRLLAHLGLAHRLFAPGNYAFGYNLFIDQDLLRGHSRGGLGLEAWKDYFRLSSNVYFPLSGWKGSPDYALALEKPAWGYDLRLKAHLPFYAKLALETGYERWPGQGSGHFAPEVALAQKRGALSWGLSWRPTPLATVRLSQGPGSKLKSEIRAAFSLNFALGHKPSGSHPDASQPQSLAGSRLDPVERDYDMPLRYKAKVKYVFKLLGKISGNSYRFQVTDAFGRPVPGLPVLAESHDPGVKVVDPQTGNETAIFVTGPDGTVAIEYQPSLGETQVSTTLSSGGDSGSFTLPLEAPSQAPPSPKRTVTVHYLGQEAPNTHLFQARHDDDDSAAPGLAVSVIAKNGVPVLDPASGAESDTFVTDQGGYFRVKLGIVPGLDHEDVTMTPQGSPGSDCRLPMEGSLTLSASRDSLPYLTDTQVGFSLGLGGEALPAGAEIELVVLSGNAQVLPQTAKVSQGGLVEVALKAQSAQAVTVMARHASLGSNAVTFSVTLSPDGLSLTASRDSLEYLSPEQVAFTVSYKGEALPAGTQASLSFDPSQLSGLPVTASLAAGGTISVPALKALVATGPITVTASALGLSSNAASFSITLSPDGLALTASRDSLEYLSPEQVAFTVSYKGEALPAGTAVSLSFDPSQLSGLPGLATLEEGGVFNAQALVALGPTGPIGVTVSALGLVSNPVAFDVSLSGSLVLEASESELEFLAPTEVAFTVSYDGKALPVGTVVGLSYVPSELGGLGMSATLGAGGTFVVPALTAMDLGGPIQIAASLGQLVSGPVAFDVIASPGGFSFSPQPAELELFVPTRTVFSFSYKGKTLPAGIGVTLGADTQELENLPQSGLTGPSGEIAAESLRAISAQGPLAVKGAVTSYQAGEALLGVVVFAENLGLGFEVTPDVAARYPELGLDPLGGPYLMPCSLFQVTLLASYRGFALANAVVNIDGFGFSPEGQTTTGQNGEIHGTVFYSKDDELEFATANGQYTLGFGGVSRSFKGPEAVVFQECF